MSDAAFDLNNSNNQVVGTSSSASLIIEEHWQKGIILVQIWREVLRVILFAGKPGEGLDEKSKREMWFLLVAAGSGYLARCWHKTLKPKPQLTDLRNDDDPDSHDSQHHLREEHQRQVVDNRNIQYLLTSVSTSAAASQPVLPEEKGETTTPLDGPRIRKTPELAPKPLKRTFSPKAFSKKLFSSDSSRNGKAFKKESALSAGGHRSFTSADGEREGSRWVGSPAVDRSLSHDAAASVGHTGSSSRRSPWSSFRSHSSSKVPVREGSPGAPDADDDSSTESSPGCLKLAGDSFRKSRRRTDSGSLSSRSLQGLLGSDVGDGRSPSAGSSRREIGSPDSPYSSSGVTNRSLSSLGAAFAAPESSEPSGELKESPEVTSRLKAAENEVKPSSKSSSPDMLIHDSSSFSIIPKDAPLNSVAAVVARIEKGNFASAKAETVNAILSLRAANEAHARAQALAQGQVGAVSDNVKARNLTVEVPEQDSVEEAEILPGGKGKRRAGDNGGKVSGGIEEGGMGAGQSVLLSTGKRTKDSKDSSKSDSSGVTLTTITGKWMKDASFVPRDVGVFDEPSTSSGIGAVDLSQVFFGFDSTFLVSSTEEKSPFRFYRRSRLLSRSGRGNMRKIRESPRPVSALESCLRAQFPERDNGSRVARSLNFSSSSDPRVEIPFLKDVYNSDSPSSSSDGREGQSPQQTQGALGLPVLATPPSRGSISRGGGGISDRGDLQSFESTSKYPRKVVYEDRGRVVSSQSQLSDVLLRPTTLPVALKKRKVSQACSPSANSTHLLTKGYELEALVIPPMEGLLFCFGVGIGVMSLVDGPDDKVERLSRELQESEEKIESLNNMLLQARESLIVLATPSPSKENVVADRDSSEQAPASPSKEIIIADGDSSEQAPASLSKEIIVADRFSSEEIVTVEVRSINLSLQSDSPLDPLSVTPAIEETERQFDLYRREAPETPQQTEHMAELEAELEAELDALTSSITDVASGPPDFEELDPEGVAGVADRDIGVEGLPAVVDWDDDNDDFIAEEPTHTGGGVPPRELSRLLRKVQNSRQEYRIAELEADLHETVERLQAMEKELQLLREKTTSFVPPSAGTGAESPESVGRGGSESPVQSDDSSWSTQIERLNQTVFEDQESRREEFYLSGGGNDSSKENTQKSSGEQSASSISLREDHESKVLGSVASEPVSSMKGSVDEDLASPLSARAASEPVSRHGDQAGREFAVSGPRESSSGGQDSVSSAPGFIPQGVVVAGRTGSGIPRSASSTILTEESMNCETQSDNDAVCDEFLSSVFGSPDGSQLGFSSVMSSPQMDQMLLSTTPEESSGPSVLSKELSLDTVAGAVGEDLDQVVGQLLKRDSSSVKNAINAFLRWEAAETDDAQSKDDFAEEEVTAGGYSRRTAGKHPTPQKTPVLSSVSSSVSPQKSSVISSRLEQLARSAFTSEKMPYVEKPVVSARRLGLTSEVISPGGKNADVFQQQKTIEVFQPQPLQLNLEDRSPRPIALREYPVTRKEHSSPTLRRVEAEKGETSMTDTLRDLFRGESPVFGGGERDFQALLDTRRELRYSSSKVQLSLTGPDTGPVFRPREEPGRAGTNSPISRPPTRNAFQSPKLKHSRIALENRLYQNPTSDWLSEVGSPPDLE